MIALAISTGIPPREWIAEGERSIATAYELLREQQQDAKGRSDGRQTSG